MAFKKLPLVMERVHKMNEPDLEIKGTIDICRTSCDDHYKTLFIQKPKISVLWALVILVICGSGSWFGIGGVVHWANEISTGMALANQKSDIRQEELIEVKSNVKDLQVKIADITPAIETLTSMVSENNKILRGKR